MKRLFLTFACSLAILATAVSCEEIQDELIDELKDQIEDQLDGDDDDDNNDDNDKDDGNNPSTDSKIVKNVTITSGDDECETYYIEFSYDDSLRITEQKLTYTYDDGEEEEFEKGIFRYEYTADQITFEYYDVEDDEEELSETITLSLNAYGNISEVKSGSEPGDKYIYSSDNRVETHINYDGVECEYSWKDGNLVETYLLADDIDLNGDGTIDENDIIESNHAYGYSKNPNDLSIDLSLLSCNGDLDEFNLAFASNFFGKRSENLVSESLSEYKCDDWTEYEVEKYSYTYTDDQLTKITLISISADSMEELVTSIGETYTIVLGY